MVISSRRNSLPRICYTVFMKKYFRIPRSSYDVILRSFAEALPASQCARLLGINRKTVDSHYAAIRATLVLEYPSASSVSPKVIQSQLGDIKKHYLGVRTSASRAYFAEVKFRSALQTKKARLDFLKSRFPFEQAV